MVCGKVFLVGAGPGDPKLLTIRALEVFKIADVVLYDRLVSPEILELISKDAKKIDVGKTHRGDGVSQLEINRILIHESKRGENVMRLKGGDPLLFSRGEEEIEAISAEGIEYEIIPGVSSAIGAATYAGIPLTRRGTSSSVALVTGHEDPTKGRVAVNFQRLASAVDTIVILMGGSKLQEISEQLVSGGARLETPVAVIESGTRPTQRIRFSTLGNILDGDLKEDIASPALIVVGEVVQRAIRSDSYPDKLQSQNRTEAELAVAIAWCAAAEFT